MTDETKLYPAWRQAEADFVELNPPPGSIIDRSWFEERFGIRPAKDIQQHEKNRLIFVGHMENLRDSLLRNHRLMLRAVIGVGYRVVPPEEQTITTVKDRGEAVRREMGKMMQELKHIRHNELTDATRAKNADAIAKLGQLSQMTRRQLK